MCLGDSGHFSASDSAAAAMAVAIYGLGLPAFVLQKVLQPLFFAREDTRSPFRYALVAMVVNAVIAVGLSPLIGFTAAAWATTLAGWAMVLLLWRGSRQMGEAAQLDARFKMRIGRIIGASLMMGAYLWIATRAMAPLFAAGSWRYAALTLVVLSGIVVYFGLAHLVGALPLSDLKRVLKRQR